MKSLLLIMCLLACSGANADYLVQNATIIEVGNTAGNHELFYIKISGGTGRCAGKQIAFNKSTAGSEAIFNRAFSMALAAYAANFPISVYDYHEDTTGCDHAEGFKLIK